MDKKRSPATIKPPPAPARCRSGAIPSGEATGGIGLQGDSLTENLLQRRASALGFRGQNLVESVHHGE
jgi:hypothetical protein